MKRTKAFLSYSGNDGLWKDRVLDHLNLLEFEGLLHVWADTQIAAGDDWYQRIQSAMDDSRVAVLLISPNFLTSKFIRNEEVPRLLQLHAENGMLILPLISRPCAWRLVPWLSRLQVRPKNGTPLSMSGDNDVDDALTSFTYEVASLLNRFTPQQSNAVVTAYGELETVCKDIHRSAQTVDDRAVMLILTLAIEHGAPIYNEGLPIDCARIYRYAASCLIELIHTSKSSGVRAKSPPSVQEAVNLLQAIIPEEDAITAKTASELAWMLRRVFDRILDVSRRNLATGFSGERIRSGC
jgi:TIR domain